MRLHRRFATTAALATVVMCSIGVGSAMASGFQSTSPSTGEGAYPASIYGSAPKADGLTLGSSLGAATCSPNWIAGPLDAAAENLVLGVHCTGKVNPSYCSLSVEPGAETSAGKFAATVAVGGSKCAGITFETTIGCKGTITPQSGASGLTVNNVSGSPDRLQLSGTVVFAATSAGGWGCPAAEKPTYAYWSSIDWTLEGQQYEAGESVDLHAVTEPHNGIEVSGGQFSAESYAAEIAGEQDTQLVLWPGSGIGSIRCDSAEFSGELTSASSSLELAAEYGNCSDSLSREVEVTMNGCEYVLGAAGTAGVTCPAGKAIEYEIAAAGGTCLIKMGGQSGLSSVGYSNTGSGVESGVEATLDLGSVATTVIGGFFKCGTFKESQTEGILKGSISMRGLQEWYEQPWLF